MTDCSSKCVVYFKNCHVNIPADRLAEAEGIVYVWRGTELVGAFDLGAIDSIYLSQCAK